MEKNSLLTLRTCVSPAGEFIYGVHKPAFVTQNLRENDYFSRLGQSVDGDVVDNRINFPAGEVVEPGAVRVFEIPNPFPFRGTTFIAESWAEARAKRPESIMLPPAKPVSLSQNIRRSFAEASGQMLAKIVESMPDPLKLALASTTTDPQDLLGLANHCCDFARDDSGVPTGLLYATDDQGQVRPLIKNHALFEIVANNRFLPDAYKRLMVLKPGVQGGNEIVGEYGRLEGETHVFEYLRRNSYIPWGHYASNMADDAVRYRIEDLTPADMQGLRHLYYQRAYLQMAMSLGIKLSAERRALSVAQLEELRARILAAGGQAASQCWPSFNRTLWGWNYGFDFAASGYRLHGSHQQIHQQFALIPEMVETGDAQQMPGFACGDLIEAFIRQYRQQTGRPFFEAYIAAINSNRRLDGRSEGPSSLVIDQDEAVMLFVPKAQTSQWEIQLMTRKPVGNIFEADTATRFSLDRGLLTAVRILSALGARMVTTIEYSKPLGSSEADQRLIYAFLPKLPESPGSFTEAQLRWINGHYPEDFAVACRRQLNQT